MSKDASVPPGEMVDMRLLPPEPGAQGEELPLRMCVIGDFTGKEEKDPINKRKVQDINSGNFDEKMKSMNLSLSFIVDNKLSGTEGAQLPVDLKIDKMDSFKPDEIANQVPHLKRLLEIRKNLVELRSEVAVNPDILEELNNLLAKFSSSNE